MGFCVQIGSWAGSLRARLVPIRVTNGPREGLSRPRSDPRNRINTHPFPSAMPFRSAEWLASPTGSCSMDEVNRPRQPRPVLRRNFSELKRRGKPLRTAIRHSQMSPLASSRDSAVITRHQLDPKSAKNKRAKRPASGEVSADRSSDKYQSTRYAQLSTFGLTFQICEMYEERDK